MMALPATPKAAKACGSLHYFTGAPCVNGHIAIRLTSNATCVECGRDIAKKSYERSPDRAIASAAKWASANMPRVREIKGKWRKNNLDLARSLEKASRLKFPETARGWRAANAESVRVLKRNYKASKRAAPGRHTAADIARIRREQQDRCGYCRVRLNGCGHVDHIIALAVGGSNWPANLQILCESCNLSKGAKDPVEFAQSLGRLI